MARSNRRSAQAALAGTADVATPQAAQRLLQVAAGSAEAVLCRVQPMGSAEAALLLDPSSTPAASSSPYTTRRTYTPMPPREPDTDQFNSHSVSDSDTESSIMDGKAPSSPSAHTPRSPFIIRALTTSKAYNLR
jgi:hypothetical protein